VAGLSFCLIARRRRRNVHLRSMMELHEVQTALPDVMLDLRAGIARERD
jgi:hypothetical protein